MQGVQRKEKGEETPLDLLQGIDNPSGGQSMDDATRNEMESKMGVDFGGVKIYTGSEAHNYNQQVNAKAFTYGQNVFFGNGNYNPSTRAGKELLAHELVHTVQQGEGVQRKVQRKPFEETESTTPKVGSNVKVDDKNPNLEQKRKESAQSAIVFDSALQLLNEGKSQFNAGDNICFPTFWFFVAYRTDAILNPPLGDYNGISDAYFDPSGDLHVRADSEDQAKVIASKWLTGAVGFQRFFWNQEELFLAAAMSEIIISSTRDAASHLKNAPENEQLKEDLANLEKYLSRGFWNGNWAVTDEDVEESLKILQAAYKRSEYDFTWLVLQLKKKDLMGNLMRNLSATHVTKYPDVVMRLAYVRPLPKLKKDVSDLVKETLIEFACGNSLGLNKKVQNGAEDAGKTTGSATGEEKFDPAKTIGAFFDIKYYEIYALSQEQGTEKEKKKTKKKLRSILIDVYQIVDLVLEILFAETEFHSDWSQLTTEIDHPIEGRKKISMGGPIVGKWKPMGKEPVPEILYTNGSGKETDEMGVEKTPPAEQNAPVQNPAVVTPTADERRDDKTKMVAFVAEKAHWFFFNLGGLMEENTLVRETVDEVVAETRKIQEKRLTAGIVLPRTKILNDPAITDQLTWLDLTKIWFWELGASDMSKIVFGANARTTLDLQQLSGVITVIDAAKN